MKSRFHTLLPSRDPRKRWCRSLAPLPAVTALLALLPLACAQNVVVGTRTADGKIVFETVDDFQINGSRKIRLLPDQTDDVDPNVVRRLPKIDMAQAALLRSDSAACSRSVMSSAMPATRE